MLRAAHALLSLTFVSILAVGCGGFFQAEGEDKAGGRGGGGHGRGGHGGANGPCHSGNGDDAGVTPVPTVDAGTVDLGEVPADAGFEDAGVVEDAALADAGIPECTTSAECPVGQQCQDQVCTECPDGVCPCQRDPECPADQICNHQAGVCEPPYVPCADVTDEAVCLARPECQAIYGGINCVDETGGECTALDPNCTCETFRFATCADRP